MCTLDELKSIARASGVPVSGTKTAVEQRLLENAVASPYVFFLSLDQSVDKVFGFLEHGNLQMYGFDFCRVQLLDSQESSREVVIVHEHHTTTGIRLIEEKTTKPRKRTLIYDTQYW